MATSNATCACCGRSAAYRSQEKHPEDFCELCAVRYGYERRGEAYTAVKTLGFAIQILRDCKIADSTIVGIVHSILTEPHSECSYDLGGDHLLGPDHVEDRPWAVPFAAIETGDAGER
jgi:hypothetical protein